MEAKKYTAEEIVQITINNLSGILVPAGLTEQIGIPIAQCISNLNVLRQMMQEAPKGEEPDELKEIDFGGEEDAGNADPE